MFLIACSPWLRAQAPLVAVEEGPVLNITGGVIGGLSLSYLNFSTNSVHAQAFPGATGGAFGRLSTGYFMFQPEVLLTQRGAKDVDDFSPSSYSRNQEVQFTTLDIPLLVGGIYTTDNMLHTIRAYAGPVIVSTVINNRVMWFNNTGSTPEFNNKAIINRRPMGALQFGLGYDYRRLTFDARYEWGLGDLNRSDQAFGGQSIRSNLVKFMVGYKFF